jgi:hypothetical protein
MHISQLVQLVAQQLVLMDTRQQKRKEGREEEEDDDDDDDDDEDDDDSDDDYYGSGNGGGSKKEIVKKEKDNTIRNNNNGWKGKKETVRYCYFGGSFIGNNEIFMEQISSLVNFFSKGELVVCYLRHEAFIGSLGVMLDSLGIPEMSDLYTYSLYSASIVHKHGGYR